MEFYIIYHVDIQIFKLFWQIDLNWRFGLNYAYFYYIMSHISISFRTNISVREEKSLEGADTFEATVPDF